MAEVGLFCAGGLHREIQVMPTGGLSPSLRTSRLPFFLLVGILVVPVAALGQESRSALAAEQAAALRALVQQAVSSGEDLPAPTMLDASAQEMLNAGRPGGRNIVESDPWGKKRFRGSGYARSDEAQQLGAVTAGVGGAVAVTSGLLNMQARIIAESEARARRLADQAGPGVITHQGGRPRSKAAKNGVGTNLAGLPADTPAKALRRIFGNGPEERTHVFYVLLGPAKEGNPGRPIRLLWRQTHGDVEAVASGSVYFVSDVEGNLLNVVERGLRYQGRPGARLKNDDKDALERFRLEKDLWLRR